jgi:hypothetical protein
MERDARLQEIVRAADAPSSSRAGTRGAHPARPQGSADKVLPQIKIPGEVIQTSLSHEADEQLREALANAGKQQALGDRRSAAPEDAAVYDGGREADRHGQPVGDQPVGEGGEDGVARRHAREP